MIRLPAIFLLLTATVAAGQSLRLVDGEVRPGRYATIEIDGFAAGDATLDGGSGTTQWRHGGGRTTLPLLVPQRVGSRWRVLMNDQAFDLDVGDVSPSPQVSAVTPTAYELVGQWTPERPQRERWAIVLAAAIGGGSILIGTRSKAKRRRPWMICALAVGLASVTSTGLLVWREWRSPVASRVAAVPVGEDVCDEWIWLTAPGAGDVRATVAATSDTLPVAFSAKHLDLLAPVLYCSSGGVPVELELTIPAGQSVAVVRKGESIEPSVPRWAGALARRFGSGN